MRRGSECNFRNGDAMTEGKLLTVGCRDVGNQNRCEVSEKKGVHNIDDIPNAPPVSTISTADLPGGVPEDQMKNAKGHKLGHLQSVHRIIDS